MNEEERSWIELRIGITPEEALAFLDDLATNKELRERLQNNPRDVLLEYNIDLAEDSAPTALQLPAPETIQHHADSLRGRSEEPYGENAILPHGFAVLLVAHGNGIIPPPPRP
jgi:hypothetical protein